MNRCVAIRRRNCRVIIPPALRLCGDNGVITLLPQLNAAVALFCRSQLLFDTTLALCCLKFLDCNFSDPLKSKNEKGCVIPYTGLIVSEGYELEGQLLKDNFAGKSSSNFHQSLCYWKTMELCFVWANIWLLRVALSCPSHPALESCPNPVSDECRSVCTHPVNLVGLVTVLSELFTQWRKLRDEIRASY